jgi:hypothetical protein
VGERGRESVEVGVEMREGEGEREIGKYRGERSGIEREGKRERERVRGRHKVSENMSKSIERERGQRKREVWREG